jgi:Ribbon-helix-helix protein, copG family
MTINRGVRATARAAATQAAERFIEGAPDATPAPRKGVMRGRKEQITLTLAPELLAKVDERAAQMGMSRAACMSLAIFQWLEREPRR